MDDSDDAQGFVVSVHWKSARLNPNVERSDTGRVTPSPQPRPLPKATKPWPEPPSPSPRPLPKATQPRPEPLALNPPKSLSSKRKSQKPKPRGSDNDGRYRRSARLNPIEYHAQPLPQEDPLDSTPPDPDVDPAPLGQPPHPNVQTDPFASPPQIDVLPEPLAPPPQPEVQSDPISPLPHLDNEPENEAENEVENDAEDQVRIRTYFGHNPYLDVVFMEGMR